jgi:hypothetical protein
VSQLSFRVEKIKFCLASGDTRTAAQLLLPELVEYKGKKIPQTLEVVFAALIAFELSSSRDGGSHS